MALLLIQLRHALSRTDVLPPTMDDVVQAHAVREIRGQVL